MRLTMFRRVLLACVVFACGAASGCAAKLPTYTWTTPDQALEIIRNRTESIVTIQAACDIMLTDRQGRSVTLDGAMVSQPPGWFRVRAWKLGRAMLDLTTTPDDVWVMLAESERSPASLPAGFDARDFAAAWRMLQGGFFEQELEFLPRSSDGRSVEFIRRSPNLDGDLFTSAIVDRARLIPLSYTRQQPGAGAQVHQVELGRYRMVGGVAVPHLLRFSSESESLVLRLRDVAINEDLATAAFKPPARAVKQP